MTDTPKTPPECNCVGRYGFVHDSTCAMRGKAEPPPAADPWKLVSEHAADLRKADESGATREGTGEDYPEDEKLAELFDEHLAQFPPEEQERRVAAALAVREPGIEAGRGEEAIRKLEERVALLERMRAGGIAALADMQNIAKQRKAEVERLQGELAAMTEKYRRTVGAYCRLPNGPCGAKISGESEVPCDYGTCVWSAALAPQEGAEKGTKG